MKRLLPALALLGLLLTAGCYTNPVTGRSSLVLISTGEEVSMGQQSFQEIRKKEKVSSEPGYNARVTRVGTRIAQVVGKDLPEAKWEFVVFDSKDINAFALPGGKVGVYTGLLKLAENDSELAIVMAHEIGHVIARHGAERMSEALVLSGLGQVASSVVEAKTGQGQVFNTAYGGITEVGRVLPHSRANESEADRMGVIYAARAGYDPRGAITFWQKMLQQKKDQEKSGSSLDVLLSTHPPDEKRIADLQALMPQVVPIYEQNKGKFQDPPPAATTENLAPSNQDSAKTDAPKQEPTRPRGGRRRTGN